MGVLFWEVSSGEEETSELQSCAAALVSLAAAQADFEAI
jgi:hypothetical protein